MWCWDPKFGEGRQRRSEGTLPPPAMQPVEPCWGGGEGGAERRWRARPNLGSQHRTRASGKRSAPLAPAPPRDLHTRPLPRASLSAAHTSTVVTTSMSVLIALIVGSTLFRTME